MSCRICGNETASYRNRSGLFLCQPCHNSTPVKVKRQTFDRQYWGKVFANVSESTRHEFYDDYRFSTYSSVDDYRHATTREV